MNFCKRKKELKQVVCFTAEEYIELLLSGMELSILKYLVEGIPSIQERVLKDRSKLSKKILSSAMVVGGLILLSTI